MDPIIESIRAWLPAWGPWLILGLTFLETSFVTGLVVPSSVATSIAVALALEGQLALPAVLGAALVGAWLGDTVGFLVGRRVGDAYFTGEGRVATLAAERRETLNRFFGRHPVYSVTLARLVSFVRTLMPMAAGMSDLPYRRYALYQMIGLFGWLALYATLGAVAGESWQVATRWLGAGGAAAFALAGAGAFVWARRRRTATAPEEKE